jgi:hypothetical protein
MSPRGAPFADQVPCQIVWVLTEVPAVVALAWVNRMVQASAAEAVEE